SLTELWSLSPGVPAGRPRPSWSACWGARVAPGHLDRVDDRRRSPSDETWRRAGPIDPARLVRAVAWPGDDAGGALGGGRARRTTRGRRGPGPTTRARRGGGHRRAPPVPTGGGRRRARSRRPRTARVGSPGPPRRRRRAPGPTGGTPRSARPRR